MLSGESIMNGSACVLHMHIIKFAIRSLYIRRLRSTVCVCIGYASAGCRYIIFVGVYYTYIESKNKWKNVKSYAA